MSHKFHIIWDQNQLPVKVVMNRDEPLLERNAENLRGGHSISQNVPTEKILKGWDLVELHHYMDDETLDAFLTEARIDDFIDYASDINLAVKTSQPTLLRHLLKRLSPQDCPITFDHYGYRSIEDQKKGESTASALDHVIQHGDAGCFDALMTHDTAMRTILSNLEAYESLAQPSQDMSRRFQRGLRFAEADPLTQAHRLSCLKRRIQDRPLNDTRETNRLQTELRAITKTLSLHSSSRADADNRKSVALLALALGMAPTTERMPIRFVDGVVPLARLIEDGSPSSWVPRTHHQIGIVGEVLAVAGTPNNQRSSLNLKDFADSRELTATEGRVHFPCLRHRNEQAAFIDMHSLELRYADYKTLLSLAGDRTAQVNHPDAGHAAERLYKTSADNALRTHSEIESPSIEAGAPESQHDTREAGGETYGDEIPELYETESQDSYSPSL